MAETPDNGPASEDVEAEASEQPSSASRRVDLTKGNLLVGIARLSWPIVAGSFLQWFLGIADMKMVGLMGEDTSLGRDAIAAVGTANGVIMTIMTAVLAVSTGTQVLVARYTGQGRRDRVEAVTRQAIILAVLVGVIFIPLGWFTAEPLMAALGATDLVLTFAMDYTRVFFLGAIALMINFMLTSALNGAGDTVTPLILLAIMNAINVLFDWLLIFGIGPFPELQVAGAAWGLVISRIVGAIVLLWMLASGRYAIHLRLLDHWLFDLKIWKKMFYIGIPSSLQGVTRNFSYMILLWILYQTDAGRLAVAGHTVSQQMGMVMVMFGLALMSAAMTTVGQNLGAGRPDRAERSGWTVVGISMVAIGVLSVLAIIFARPLIGFFTDDPDAVGWGVVALRIIAAVQPIVAGSMAFSGALRGAGDTLSPLYASLIFTMVVGPALAWTLSSVFEMGPTGVWLGLAIAWVMQAIMVAWIFKLGKWKQIEL